MNDNTQSLINSSEYKTFLKESNDMLQSLDKTDTILLFTHETKIVNHIRQTNIVDDSYDPLNDYKNEDEKFVFIEYVEDKKIQFLEIENELIELRDTFIELYDIVKNDEHDFEIIDANISHAKNMIAQAELDLICAKTNDESYTRYLIVISVLVSAIAIVLKSIIKE